MEKDIQLRDFISSTLVEIASGVMQANKEIANRPFRLETSIGDYAKDNRGIEFDILVSASKSQDDKAGFFVALANIGGAASARKTAEDAASHRIRFVIRNSEHLT